MGRAERSGEELLTPDPDTPMTKGAHGAEGWRDSVDSGQGNGQGNGVGTRRGHAQPAGSVSYTSATGDLGAEPAAPGRQASAARRVTGPNTVPLAARERGKGFRSVLRNKYFLRLWMAQLISQTIMNAANYGIIVLIATNSRSVTATGGAIISFSLPAAIFGAPAGVVVDRFDKRRVLWMSNALRAVATVGFVVSLFIDTNALIPVYVLTFFISLVGQFFAPAEGAAIPLLVHEDELVNALALFNITFTLSQALGLIILGPLVLAALPAFGVGAFGGHAVQISQVQSLFLLVSLLYVVCAVLVGLIPRSRLVNRGVHAGPHTLAHEGERIRGIWTGIWDAWTFIRRENGLLGAVIQLSLAGTVVAVVAMIAPQFVEDFFHRPAQLAALVFIPAGVGLVLGSAFIPHLVKVSHRGSRHSVLIGLGTGALAGAVLLLTFVHWAAHTARPNTWYHSWVYIIVVLVLTFIIGLALDLVNVPAQTVLQERSPDWIKGRVLALQIMMLNVATVPVVYFMGRAADAWGLPPAMNLMAVGVLVAGFGSIVYGARRARRARVVSRPVAQRTRVAANVLAAGDLAGRDRPTREHSGRTANRPGPGEAPRSFPLEPHKDDPVEL
jgi:MFS family permease